MQQPGQVERVWWPRLRWRMRGAWQWPAFAVLTPLDAVLLMELPPYAGAPDDIVPAMLLAGFANLVAVALVAPLAGVRVRRARPDLPRPVAVDYAGFGALVAVTFALVAAGLAHRPAEAAARADVAAVVAATRQYVEAREPEHRPFLPGMNAQRIDDELFRSCVPGPDPDRWLCLFVSTDQHPPGVTRDGEALPNP